jgi:hypothetical protein
MTSSYLTKTIQTNTKKASETLLAFHTHSKKHKMEPNKPQSFSTYNKRLNKNPQNRHTHKTYNKLDTGPSIQDSYKTRYTY